MSQPPSLSDWLRCSVPMPGRDSRDRRGQFPKYRLRVLHGVDSGLMDKRAVGDRIIKREHLFQMRPG